MMLLSRLLLIFSMLSIFSGCTYFSKKFESMAQENIDSSRPLSTKKINYCPANSKLQYISEDEYTSKFYAQLHPQIFENKNFSFVKKFVVFSLLEMSRRPDIASPFSRFQFYLRVNGKNYYYDFRPKAVGDDQKMPFMRGLDYLTQRFIPGQSLLSISSEMDTIIPTGLPLSQDFENFLRNNKAHITANEELTNRFIKGDEVLTRYETFNRVSYRALADQYLKNYSKPEDYVFDNNPLNLNKSKKENYQANCNYNLNKEMSLKDSLMAIQEPKYSHYIGISEGDDFFLAVTSSDLVTPFTTIPKLGYFMKSKIPSTPLPICEFIGSRQEIVLFSNKGRNPVQHLQHLVAYDIDQIDSAMMLNELLNFSRHLFLSNPDRILYESKRGRKAQLDFFLAMNFPIYHVENLGNLVGHAIFKHDNKSEKILYSDDRSSARLWCK